MVMTPEEFLAKMEEIRKDEDTEARHGTADSLLCHVLTMLGYEDGVRVFNEMTKWYA